MVLIVLSSLCHLIQGNPSEIGVIIINPAFLGWQSVQVTDSRGRATVQTHAPGCDVRPLLCLWLFVFSLIGLVASIPSPASFPSCVLSCC